MKCFNGLFSDLAKKNKNSYSYLVFEEHVNFILFAFKIKYRVPKPAVSNLKLS